MPSLRNIIDIIRLCQRASLMKTLRFACIVEAGLRSVVVVVLKRARDQRDVYAGTLSVIWKHLFIPLLLPSSRPGFRKRANTSRNTYEDFFRVRRREARTQAFRRSRDDLVARRTFVRALRVTRCLTLAECTPGLPSSAPFNRIEMTEDNCANRFPQTNG